MGASPDFDQRIKSKLEEFVQLAGKSYGFSQEYFADFVSACEHDVKAAVPQLFSGKDELDDYQLDDEAMDELEEIHRNFVVVPTDKNAKQPTIICKRFYSEQCLKILENSDDFEEAQDKPTVIAETLTTFAESQGLRMTAETDKNGMEKEPQLPSLHLTAKLHKDPVAFRHIQGSRFTPLTLVAKTVRSEPCDSYSCRYRRSGRSSSSCTQAEYQGERGRSV